MMARPTKYQPDRVAALLDALRVGATIEHAAAAAGVHRDTVHGWRQRYPAFDDAINRAAGEGVVACLRVVSGAATSGTWQAAAWLLERRYPAEYGRRAVTVATSVQVGQADRPDPMEQRKRLLDFLDSLDNVENDPPAAVEVLPSSGAAVTVTAVVSGDDDDPWHAA